MGRAKRNPSSINPQNAVAGPAPASGVVPIRQEEGAAGVSASGGASKSRRVFAKRAAEQANAQNAVAGPAPASGVVPLPQEEGEGA